MTILYWMQYNVHTLYKHYQYSLVVWFRHDTPHIIIHHPLSIVHSPSSYHHIIISSYHHIITSSYHHIIMSSSIIHHHHHHHHHFLANIPISISLVIDPSSITIPHFYLFSDRKTKTPIRRTSEASSTLGSWERNASRRQWRFLAALIGFGSTKKRYGWLMG